MIAQVSEILKSVRFSGENDLLIYAFFLSFCSFINEKDKYRFD